MNGPEREREIKEGGITDVHIINYSKKETSCMCVDNMQRRKRDKDRRGYMIHYMLPAI